MDAEIVYCNHSTLTWYHLLLLLIIILIMIIIISIVMIMFMIIMILLLKSYFSVNPILSFCNLKVKTCCCQCGHSLQISLSSKRDLSN